MNDLDARTRAMRLAAALGLTAHVNGSDRHGYGVILRRGDERVDGCVSPNAVDAWCDAERRLRALARAELPAAASAAESARYGAGLRAAAEHEAAKAARALDAARERLRAAAAGDAAARSAFAAAREALPDDRARAILDALAALNATTETTTR